MSLAHVASPIGDLLGYY